MLSIALTPEWVHEADLTSPTELVAAVKALVEAIDTTQKIVDESSQFV